MHINLGLKVMWHCNMVLTSHGFIIEKSLQAGNMVDIK